MAKWLESLTCNHLPLSALGLGRSKGRIYMKGRYQVCLRMMRGSNLDVKLGLPPSVKAGSHHMTLAIECDVKLQIKTPDSLGL